MTGSCVLPRDWVLVDLLWNACHYFTQGQYVCLYVGYEHINYDYTIWPLWVDTHVKLPFMKTKNGTVVDKHGYEINLYDDVMDILKWLQNKDVKLALASRTNKPQAAYELIKLFEIDDYFHFKEIYPGCKVKHFNKFSENSQIPYDEMLFFDDEERNIWDINNLGVTCIHIPFGITKTTFQEGLTIYSDKFDSSNKNN